MKKLALIVLLVLCGSLFASAEAVWPPDPWRNVDLRWNYKTHDVVCHDKSAVFVGEERKTMLATIGDGAPVQRTFRAMTYRCAVNHEEIVVWLDVDSHQVRDVTCHQGKVCTDNGYNSRHHGEAMVCPEGHTFYLIGAKHP